MLPRATTHRTAHDYPERLLSPVVGTCHTHNPATLQAASSLDLASHHHLAKAMILYIKEMDLMRVALSLRVWKIDVEEGKSDDVYTSSNTKSLATRK